MKVNIAVCGKFHYFNYIKYLCNSKEINLNRFYYSHKLNSNKILSSNDNDYIKFNNIWFKEYLLRFISIILQAETAIMVYPLLHNAWENSVVSKWSKCDLLHLMLHGTSLKIIQKAKSQSSLVIGEAVNSHPSCLHRILNEEYIRLGLGTRPQLSIPEYKMLNEMTLCDYILVPSEFVRQSYIKEGFDVQKVVKIPFGVNTNKFFPSQSQAISDKDVFRVLCVASVSPRKGQIDLLNAWKSLKLPNSELLLIGSVSKVMRKVLASFEGTFRHISNVPHSQIREYYDKSSVFVLPSLEEGLALVIGEAMSCGLPVIATENTGASELIEHGKEGFIVPIRSPQIIAEYIEKLYIDRNLLHQMSNAAAKKSTSFLGWDKYASQLSDFYLSIYKEKGL